MPTRALRTRLAARQGNQGPPWVSSGCREGQDVPAGGEVSQRQTSPAFLLPSLPPFPPQHHTHPFRPWPPLTQLLTD